MLHFRMNMPFYLCAFYGSIMIVIVLALRALLKNKLPKFVFPLLWGVVLVRLLVPFSLSSPLSLPVPEGLLGMDGFSLAQFEETAQAAEDSVDLQSGTAGSNYDVVTHTDAWEDQEATGTENIDQAVVEEVVYGTDTSDRSAIIYYNDEYVRDLDSFFSMRTMRRTLPVLYLLGLAAVAGILAWQKINYGKKLHGGLLMEHNETVNELLRDMGMGHVLVFSNDEIASPLVCGILNPRILLPTRMDFENNQLLRHVLAHETMHIRRRDNLVKAVMLAAILLNWYNPLVWLMAKCLASDLEAACDAAVLNRWGGEERKEYACSLLAMAVSASRSSLLYSAFSKTEVERRVKDVLAFRKATAFGMLFSVMLLTAGTVVFATGGQAPFSHDLTSYCASSNSRWGVRVEITRDIALGKQAQKRAEDTVFSVLNADTRAGQDTREGKDTLREDPDIIREEIRTALAREFGVERSAFDVALSLCLSSETVDAQYAAWGITRQENGTLLYQGEQVRTYRDEMLGSYQSRGDGPVDIVVERDRMGEITGVRAVHAGDAEYDRRTGELGLY